MRHNVNGARLEAKVVIPTISTAVLYALIGALYYLVTTFGVSFSDAQEQAFAGVGIALAPLIQFTIGYYSPHTPRFDVSHVGTDEV